MIIEYLLCDKCCASHNRHKDRQDIVPNPTESSSLVEKGKHIRKSQYNGVIKIEICLKIDKGGQKSGTELMEVES